MEVLDFEVLDFEEDAVICLAGGVGPHYAAYLPQSHQNRIRPALGTALDGALALAGQAHKKEGSE